MHLFHLFFQIYVVVRSLDARYHNHLQASRITTEDAPSNTALCYDANKKHHLRLWNGDAPGAIGNDPCNDIPFLRVFVPDGLVPRTDTGIIVLPGGGYDRLTNVKEQTPVARYFGNELGITTFVLYYRLVKADGTYRYPVPMWDGQRALRYVRFYASQFGLDPNRLGVFGFSAGGHLGATIALHFDQHFALPNQDDLDSTHARPDFLGLGYPVISMDPREYASPSSRKHLLSGYTGQALVNLQNFLSVQKHVGPKTPPTFLFTSIDDRRVSWQNSLLFVKALESAGIAHEAHIYQHGKHGDGLATHSSEEYTWPGFFHQWLIQMNFLCSSERA